jgi:predicted nucleic acid-binding protein
MSIFVIDANASLAWLRGELGGDITESHLSDPSADCIAHSVNLCEVYYDALRRTDLAGAEQAINDLFALGLKERADMDTAFWRIVGQLKVTPGKMAFADCFALALAIRTGGTLLTADHHEFDKIVPLGLCPILFIR